MIEEDMTKLRARDLRRLRVLHQVLGKRLTQVQAAAFLGLTDRHVRRLVQRVRREGDRAVVHWRRGQPSNRRLPAVRPTGAQPSAAGLQGPCRQSSLGGADGDCDAGGGGCIWPCCSIGTRDGSSAGP